MKNKVWIFMESSQDGLWYIPGLFHVPATKFLQYLIQGLFSIHWGIFQSHCRVILTEAVC